MLRRDGPLPLNEIVRRLPTPRGTLPDRWKSQIERALARLIASRRITLDAGRGEYVLTARSKRTGSSKPAKPRSTTVSKRVRYKRAKPAGRLRPMGIVGLGGTGVHVLAKLAVANASHPKPKGLASRFLIERMRPLVPSPAFKFGRVSAKGIEVRVKAPESAVPVQPLDPHLLEDPRCVPVWFATNREPVSAERSNDGFGARLAEVVHRGYCVINVPQGYVRGGSGRGFLGRLLQGEKTQLELGSITVQEDREHWERLRASLRKLGGTKVLLVFIHGFRTTFAEAAERAGQLSYELRVPVGFFSWPSGGRLARYSADEERIRESRDAIRDYLLAMAEVARDEGRRLCVIAHSMGNRGLVDALESIALRRTGRPGIEHVVFAAPDVPVREFRAKSAGFLVGGRKWIKGCTLYSAKDDLALWTSKLLHDNPRAGIIATTPPPPQPHVFDGIDSVDVTQFNVSLLGHGYCFDLGPVLDDMHAVLTGTVSRRRVSAMGGRHWVLT